MPASLFTTLYSASACALGALFIASLVVVGWALFTLAALAGALAMSVLALLSFSGDQDEQRTVAIPVETAADSRPSATNQPR